MGVSRRDFLMRVGQAGGYSAAFSAMQGLGLMPRAVALEPMTVAPGTGKGLKVVIAGAGIGGLVAAYELRALGYDCTVLEARARPGGRNWTVRGGDHVDFLDGTKQRCEWDPGNYQNVGPARLPSTHLNMLGYCRKLGVELQVEVNTTRSSFLQNDNSFGGKPVVQRQAINDTRGHVSELLMKCVNAGNLDADLSADDKTRMLDFLRIYGPLDNAGKYVGSDRAGYSVYPGAGNQDGVLSKPLDMDTLLHEDFWQGLLYEEVNDWQATMFQPVGGMDRIPYAFSKSLGTIIKYDSPVTSIMKKDKGVTVMYTSGGSTHSIDADYCVCDIPLSILKKTDNNFSAPYKQVIADSTFGYAYKVVWESRRFWEQDYNIYGGLEFVSQGPSPVWFPSAGMFSPRGVMVSGYTDIRASGFDKMTLPQVLDASRSSVEKLHPGHGKELEKPIYVNWGQIKWNEGSWIAGYGDGQTRGGNGATRQGSAAPAAAPPRGSSPGYEIIIQPDGPVYFTGDTCSHIVGWQEGAAVASLRTVKMISEHANMARLASTAGRISA
jgi:monoamine oxidase